MLGPERALLYQVAVETGLRAGELRSLTRNSFDFEVSPATVTVGAANAKNKRTATLPLRPATAALLREHCRRLLPKARVFRMPDSTHTAKMMREDLKAAGFPYKDDAGRYADFHALRHTFLTNLANSGVHPKTAQELARHSDINLTMSRYTHSRLEQQSEAVQRLPDLSVEERAQARKTGTSSGVHLGSHLATQGGSDQIDGDQSRQAEGEDAEDEKALEVPEKVVSGHSAKVKTGGGRGIRTPGTRRYSGFQVRLEYGVTFERLGTYDRVCPDLASCLATLKQHFPDLSPVVNAWGGLPQSVREGILAIVAAIDGATP